MSELQWKLWSKEPPVETGVYWLMEFFPICEGMGFGGEGNPHDCRKPKLTPSMKWKGFKSEYCMGGKFASCLKDGFSAPFIWELDPIPPLHEVQGIADSPADQMFWYGPILAPPNPEGEKYDNTVLWKGEGSILYEPVYNECGGVVFKRVETQGYVGAEKTLTKDMK